MIQQLFHMKLSATGCKIFRSMVLDAVIPNHYADIVRVTDSRERFFTSHSYKLYLFIAILAHSSNTYSGIVIIQKVRNGTSSIGRDRMGIVDTMNVIRRLSNSVGEKRNKKA
jgi:hypothetical protein